MNVKTNSYQLKNLKIASIIEDGRLGGPQIYSFSLANYLSEKIETVLIFPKENSEVFQHKCDESLIKYHLLPITRITKELRPALHYILYSPMEVFKLMLLFRREQFDLIYVSGGSWQFKGAIAGKLAGIPVLWHLNDSYMPWVFRQFFRLLSGVAVGYTYASERTKAYYAPYVSSNKFEFTIPAPVATTRFDPELKFTPDELFPELGEKLVIGTVANINPIKGLETFIKSALEIQKKNHSIAFVVVGPIFKSQQKYHESLQKLLGESELKCFYWAGPRQDVRPLLKRFDVYVCSSIAESSPISVWEAMSMAKPIVSTDVGDVPLYVNNQENGFVVPVGDSEKMASRVLELINDGEMRKRFGLRSRKVAQQHLDIARCGERHLQAYQQIHSSQHKQLLC